MDKFLKPYKMEELNYEEIANVKNIPKTSEDTESVIKHLPQNKSLEPTDFISQFYQKSKCLIPDFLKKVEKEGMNASYLTL